MLYLEPMSFRLYVRLTTCTRENYTAGSSIFRKLYLRCKNYTLWLSKIGIFYALGLGVRPNILTPVTFYCKSPLGAASSCLISNHKLNLRYCFLFTSFSHHFSLPKTIEIPFVLSNAVVETVRVQINAIPFTFFKVDVRN